MEKNIEYYLNLPYTRELIPEPEGGWFVRVKELPGCMSQGDTPDEAMEMIADAMRGWLAAELRSGSAIPEPRLEEDFSGKFVVRVPKSLHRKMDEAADREGVSLNQWISTALAEAVGSVSSRPAATAIKTEASAAGSAWPGLSDAVQRVLIDVGMHQEAGVLDERLFAGWLEQNLEEIHVECQQAEFEQGLVKTRALSLLLQEHQNHSPLMHSLYKMVVDIGWMLEQTCAMNQTVLEAEKMQAQISAIIGSVNSHALDRTYISENERLSYPTSSAAIEVPIKKTDTSKW